MSPSMMQCCPVGNMGPRPMMNPTACGPPQFRSFHSDLATARFQSPRPFSGSGVFGGSQAIAASVNTCCPQPRVAARPICRPVCQSRPVCQPQPVCVQPPVVYAPRYCVPPAPVQAKPWRLPWSRLSFPKFGNVLPKQTVSCQAVSRRWLPVVNDGSASAPCGDSGCGEEVFGSSGSSYSFDGDGCGEEVPYLGMTSQPTANLSPVPAPPVESELRYFPNSGEHRKQRKPQPKQRESEAYYFDPPPAAERLPDPPDDVIENLDAPAVAEDKTGNEAPVISRMMEPLTPPAEVSPASKPAMSDPINPFEDIEDAEPEASLPVEAEMPQAILMIPQNVFPPLHIPRSEVVTVASSAVQATPLIRSPVEVPPIEIPSVAVSSVDWLQPIRAAQVIRQVSERVIEPDPQMPWQSIELKEGFFGAEQPTRTHQKLAPGVQSQTRQVQQHTVVRRSVVEDAEQLVPIRRVITRRRQ